MYSLACNRTKKSNKRKMSKPGCFACSTFPSKKLFRFQVCGGERTETKTPQRKSRDLFFDMCWVPCSSHNLPKLIRNGQKTWQRREKKRATWKDNKYQQTKEEMERATRSKRKTNVTIWWWPCWSWRPQKLNSVGSILEHTGRQNVATNPDSAQKRPNGTCSPLPSVKEN